MHALEVKGLAKRYGSVTALAGISLYADHGEVVGLIGPNGAGKTTTMRAILGLIAADEGSICFDGVRLEGIARSDRVGALVDRPAVYPHLTSIANLMAAATALGMDQESGLEASGRLITLLGLESAGKRPLRTYSTGFRQRLGIAMALLGDAKVVVLDEPTNGLDPEGIAFVRRLLRDMASEGRAVLLSSHLLDEVEHACDRVVILAHGKVVAHGRPADLVGVRSDLVLGFASEDEAQRAAVALRATGIDVRLSRDRLVLPDRGKQGPAVGELLARSRLFPTELSASTTRLEDAFFEITGAVDRNIAR